MADDYVGKSPGSLKEIFYKKQNMKKLIREEHSGPVDLTAGPAFTNILDFHIGEGVLFGKVNTFFLPIVPNTDHLKYFRPDYVEGEVGDIQAIDFVVDQFELMAAQFQKATMNGDIISGEPHLSEIKIHRAYHNPYELYDKYLQLLITALRSRIKAANIQIASFDEFMPILLQMLKNSALEFPLTLPGYVKSKHYSATNSGLVLEIATLDYDDNKQTVEEFYNNPNWEFWLNACDSYGFAVDGNAPWRIMADLNSRIMIHAALRYGPAGSSAVLTDKFKSAAHIFVLKEFIPVLLKIYNAVRTPKISRTTVCRDNTLRTSLEDSQVYNIESLQNAYSLEYFAKQYFEIRFLEEESQFTPSHQNALIRDALAQIKMRGAYSAILYFEIILNKPFDYRGSISYSIKEKKVLDARKLSPEEEEAKIREIERETNRIRHKNGLPPEY